MPIQMTNHAPGMTAEAYDEVMTRATAPMCAAAGFIARAGGVPDPLVIGPHRVVAP